jgi:hypothetical protein
VHPFDLGGCLQLDHGFLTCWYYNTNVALAV